MSSKKIISIGFIACIVPVFVFAQGYYDKGYRDKWGNWKSDGGNNGGWGWSWWAQPRQQQQQQPRQPRFIPRERELPTFYFNEKDHVVHLPEGKGSFIFAEGLQIPLSPDSNAFKLIGKNPNAQFLAKYDEGINKYQITVIKNQPLNSVAPSSPWGPHAPAGVKATTIIKFSAKWCVPWCQLLSETIHGIPNRGFEVIEVDIETPIYSKEIEDLGITQKAFNDMVAGVKNLPTMIGFDSDDVMIGTVTGAKDKKWFTNATVPRKSDLSDKLPELPPKGDNSKPSPFSPTKEETDKKPTVTPNGTGEVDVPITEEEALKRIKELKAKIQKKEQERKNDRIKN